MPEMDRPGTVPKATRPRYASHKFRFGSLAGATDCGVIDNSSRCNRVERKFSTVELYFKSRHCGSTLVVFQAGSFSRTGFYEFAQRSGTGSIDLKAKKNPAASQALRGLFGANILAGIWLRIGLGYLWRRSPTCQIHTTRRGPRQLCLGSRPRHPATGGAIGAGSAWITFRPPANTATPHVFPKPAAMPSSGVTGKRLRPYAGSVRSIVGGACDPPPPSRAPDA